MNNETKAAKAIEWLRTVDRDDDDYEDLNTILIHIDGEDARRAPAIEEARRIGAVTGCAYEGFGCFSETPIDPPCDGCLRDKAFADRIAELERCQRCSREDACFHLCGDCGDEPGVVADLHVAKLRAEAERDTLRARIAELEAQALDLCMTIGQAREDNLALVADNEKLTAKIKNKG